MKAHRTLLVGVGGQGVLTAAQILGAAAHAQGLPVVVGQIHGMSQRGGSVECTVKVGAGESSVIGPGEADVVLAFEPLEALRALPCVSRQTRALVCVTPIVPFDLTRSGRAYPPVSAILDELAAAALQVVTIDGAKLVAQTGSDRTLNAVMLGAAAALGWAPVRAELLVEKVLEGTAEKFRGANQHGFTLGGGAVRGHVESARA